MYISARERMILEKLLSINGETTVKDLSKELGVSERTVHRDLKNVETTLSDHGIKLLKKSGVGIQISGNKDDIEKLQLILYNQTPVEFTPDERQTIILCALLEADEPIKLISLANDLNVTIVTVSNDLNKLEKRLFGYDLSLNKKRGYGIELTGAESAKRKAMRDIIYENMDEVDFLSLIRENIQKQSQNQMDPISERLLGLVEKKKLVIVERIIKEVNKKRDYSIADSAYIGLVVHLALAIERIQRGENIKMDDTYLQNLQSSSEYKIAKQIVEKLSMIFQLDIPVAEIGYITMHLQGAKLRQNKEYLIDHQGLEAAEKANLLIQFVEKKLNYNLSNNFSFFSGLVTHLEPALYRIKKNMGIYNPLLGKIKQDYQKLFDVIKEGTKSIFPNMFIPDEEIGFLVLHFGSAILTNKKTISLKALIICSTGIGTSKILATQIAREFPDVNQLKNVSLFELDRLNVNAYDLVISTIQIPKFSHDYIIVSPILTQVEIDKIRTTIHDKKDKQMLKKQPKGFIQKSKGFIDFQTSIEKIDEIEKASKTILNILKNFEVRSTKKENMIDVLNEVCLHLEKNKIISEASPIVKALLDREKLGGLGIPDSQLALFHAKNNNVLKPVFIVIALETPIRVNSMSQGVMEISSMLLLLAPNQLSSRQMEILSYISAMIIENQESITLFESKNETLISTYLADKLMNYIGDNFWE